MDSGALADAMVAGLYLGALAVLAALAWALRVLLAQRIEESDDLDDDDIF